MVTYLSLVESDREHLLQTRVLPFWVDVLPHIIRIPVVNASLFKIGVKTRSDLDVPLMMEVACRIEYVLSPGRAGRNDWL